MLRAAIVCSFLVPSLAACGGETAGGSQASPADSPKTTADVPKRDQWQAGVHYEVVQPAAPVPASGKVIVTEFFWFGCPHCYTFEPHLVLWNRRKPEQVELLRVPTTWGPYDRPHARLFYTLEALGRGDLYAEVFDAIHREGNRLASMEEEETKQLQLEFARGHGISTEQFLAAYDSTAVQTRLQDAERLVRHYQVAKLPTLVVSGKYKTDVTRTGRSAEQLIQLIGDLAAGESRRLD